MLKIIQTLSIFLLRNSNWITLNKSLEHIKKLIAKDPLEILSEEDRKSVLLCRDYICTIPSSLELFLRSINWFNPIEVNLARIYLKRWAKIDPEDAISLLDARFPDTYVRKYAVSILAEMTDDLLNLYMLQLCQSLMYELYHITPLADFLIEKSLKSPNIVGVSFYWNATICMKNKLFKERLSVITTQILMLSGQKFIDKMEISSSIEKKLKNIASECKKRFHHGEKKEVPEKTEIKEKKEKKEKTVNFLQEKVHELNMTDFQLPGHASYFAKKFLVEKCNVFSSKMVPIKLACESTDQSPFSVIYKCGIK